VSQNRFSALRQFAIEVRTAGPANNNCGFRSTPHSVALGYQRVFTIPADAFPGGTPRPLSPQLILRSFDVPDRTATHVRLVVLSNQCTGNPAYHGDQDNDPAVHSDCRTTGAPDEAVLAPQDTTVRAAELEVF
jgi:extracellular elastinolytic metalloproteinase